MSLRKEFVFLMVFGLIALVTGKVQASNDALQLHGIKIGDSLEEVKKAVVGKISPDQKVVETTCSDKIAPHVCFMQVEKPGSRESESILKIYFTGKPTGNVVFALFWNYTPQKGKDIVFETVINDLINKYGSNFLLDGFDDSTWKTYRNWAFNSENEPLKLMEINYGRYLVNKDGKNDKKKILATPQCFFPERPEIIMYDCQGKRIGAEFNMVTTHGKIDSMKIGVIDYDLLASAQKAQKEFEKSLINDAAKEQLQKAKSNKVSF